MFDYVSPFDALASSSAGKKKADVGYASAESRDTEDSWTSVSTSVDPKRKSVENLMDQLARSQGPPQATQQPFDSYGAEPGTPPNELASKVPPPPLPPKPLQGQGSPRASPPFVQRSQQGRSGESPLLQSGGPKPPQLGAGPSSKERAGSPLAKGNWKAQDSKQRVPAPRKPLISPKCVLEFFWPYANRHIELLHICIARLRKTLSSTCHRILTASKRLATASDPQPSRW